MEKENLYTVKRYIVEEYETVATSRENAKMKVAIWGNPSKITTLKETVKRTIN